jgi:HEAT repeat protein
MVTPSRVVRRKTMSFLSRLFGPPDVDKLRDRRDVEGLIKALSHQKQADVRRKAAEALGRIGDTAGVPALIEALDDTDKGVRLIAAYWLGNIGHPTAVPALMEALVDTSRGVRTYAAVALGMIGDPAAVPALSKALHDSDEEVRLEATKSLGKIGDRRAIDPLEEMVEDKSEVVRDRASEALERIEPGPPAASRCAFCGKELHEGTGIRTMSLEGDDPFDAMQQAAQQMLARKVVCSSCGAVYCLECGNAVGIERGTGKTHCPDCGKAVPSSQLM